MVEEWTKKERIVEHKIENKLMKERMYESKKELEGKKRWWRKIKWIYY